MSTEKTALYIPERMSGAWAVLCSLTMRIGDAYRVLQLRQDEVIQLATALSTHSFVVVNHSGQTAWDSAQRLDPEYMSKQTQNGIQFSLTNKGYELGKKCLIFERDQFKKHFNCKFSLCYANTNENNNNKKRDIDNDTSGPPIKKRKSETNPWYKFVNDSMYGGLYTPITNNLDQNYDLTKRIKINGKEYYFYLNIASKTKIHENFQNESKILLKQLDLSGCDFAFLLQEIDDDDEDNIYILPFIIETTSHPSDLAQLINARQIYLLVVDQGTVKQARVDAECRDNYFVHYTQSQAHTQRTLVNWTFMVRHWINGAYNSDFNIELTTKLSVVKNNATKKSQQVKTMQQILMCVDGCREMDAFYITRKYPNMRALYDAWDACILQTGDEEEKQDICNAQIMLHRQVSVFTDWKFKYDLLQTQECTVNPDNDVVQSILILKKSGFDDGRTPISKELSQNIFSKLYLKNNDD